MALTTTALLMEDRPQLPCVTAGCRGYLFQDYARDAYSCYSCGFAITKTAMVRITAPIMRYWQAAGGVPPEGRGQIMANLMQMMRAEHVEYQRRVEKEDDMRRYKYTWMARYTAAVEQACAIGPYQYTIPGSGHPLSTSGPIATEHGTKTLEATTTIPQADEAIIAWRSWVVKRRDKGPKTGDTTLRSVTYGTNWLGSIPYHARCIKAWQKHTYKAWAENTKAPKHSAPEPECECGVYAKITAAGAADWAGTDSRWLKIIGKVSLWGRVLLFTEGYRAEYAYPYVLYVPRHIPPPTSDYYDDAEHMARELRDLYKCDVEIVDFEAPELPEWAR